LLQKGCTKIALYGIGYIRDDRLNRCFERDKVLWQRPLLKKQNNQNANQNANQSNVNQQNNNLNQNGYVMNDSEYADHRHVPPEENSMNSSTMNNSMNSSMDAGGVSGGSSSSSSSSSNPQGGNQSNAGMAGGGGGGGAGGVMPGQMHPNQINPGGINPQTGMPDNVDTSYYNICLFHQNRYKGNRDGMANKNSIKESMLPSWLDLVIWGHEHECKVDPVESKMGKYHIIQPGSTIATSCIAAEAVQKKVVILELYQSDYRIIKIPLKTVRPFRMEDCVLLAAEQDGIIKNCKDDEGIYR
jgi:hypothetical protein